MASIVSHPAAGWAAALTVALTLVAGLAAPGWAGDTAGGWGTVTPLPAVTAAAMTSDPNAWQIWEPLGGRSEGHAPAPMPDTATGDVGAGGIEAPPLSLVTLDPPVGGLRSGGVSTIDRPRDSMGVDSMGVDSMGVDSMGADPRVTAWPDSGQAHAALRTAPPAPRGRDDWSGMPGTGAWGPRAGDGAAPPTDAALAPDMGEAILWNPPPQTMAPSAGAGSRWEPSPLAPDVMPDSGDPPLAGNITSDDALAPVRWDTAAAGPTGGGWVGGRLGNRMGSDPARLAPSGSGWTVAAWTAPDGNPGCRASSHTREGNGRHRVSIGRAGGATYLVLDSPVFQKRTRPFTATLRIDALYSRDLRFTVQGGAARALITDMPAFLQAFRGGYELVLQHRGRDRAHVSLIGSSASIADLRACLGGGARRL